MSVTVAGDRPGRELRLQRDRAHPHSCGEEQPPWITDFSLESRFSPLSTCTRRPALVTLPVHAGVDGNGEEGAGFAPATDAPAQGDTGTGRCWAHGTPRVQHCIQLTPSHRRNLPSGWAEGLTETSGLWLPQVCVINCTIPAQFPAASARGMQSG